MKDAFLRNIVLSAFLMLTVLQSSAQIKYTVSGRIDNVTEPTQVYLTFRMNKEIIRDSAITRDGAISFKGKLPRPFKAGLSMKAVSADPMKGYAYREFYVSEGVTRVTGKSLNKSVVKGGKEQKDYEAYLTLIQPLRDSIARYFYWGKNEDSLKRYNQMRPLFIRQMEDLTYEYIKANGNSYVAFDMVKERAVIVIDDPDKMEPAFQALSKKFKTTSDGKQIAKAISIAKRFRIGQPVIDFRQTDSSGNDVTYAAFKGKYVLIDFWASWCYPCRVEYPFLKKAYQQYKDKNFEIIGISLDSKREDWVKAIRENGFAFTMASDLKGRDNAIAVAYGITAIPQNLLVDPNGIIIAKNMRGEDLLKKLEEVIK
jgi:peroxiredoxin